MPNTTTRRSYSGHAKTTTLASGIVGGSDTSFVIADATGWPDGSGGNFVVTVDIGTATEEKILCSTRTGTTVNVASRGYEGTTAQAHSSLTNPCAHTYSSTDADEANAHTSAASGVHGVAGSVVGTSDTQTLTNKTLTSPTINSPTINTPTVSSPTVTSATLDAASTIGGVSGTSLAADRTAWTTYTPTFGGGLTGVSGEFAYKQIGKTLHLRLYFSAGSSIANNSDVTVTLPAGLSAGGAVNVRQALAVCNNVPAGSSLLAFATSASTHLDIINLTGGSMSPAGMCVTGVIEVA